MAIDTKVTERYNLNIKKWGNAGWIYLTAIVLQYPENPSADDKKHYKAFLTMNGFVIPCIVCRVHYQKNLEKYPLTDKVLSSRRNLANWLNQMHNQVNIDNEKPVVGVLEMIAEYMPPGMALPMLINDEEYEQLKVIDNSKNNAFVQSQYMQQCDGEDRGCGNRWWFWLIVVILIILLVLFICSMIKSACMRKSIKPIKSIQIISPFLE